MVSYIVRYPSVWNVSAEAELIPEKRTFETVHGALVAVWDDVYVWSENDSDWTCFVKRKKYINLRKRSITKVRQFVKKKKKKCFFLLIRFFSKFEIDKFLMIWKIINA